MNVLKLGRLLIVDDEIELMSALRDALVELGYDVVGVSTAEEALAALDKSSFDILMTDLMLGGMTGIELLRAALQIDSYLIGIVMTGYGTIQTAVEAMKMGAFDYVLKPFKLQTLLPLLSRALHVRRLRVDNVQLRETVSIYELSQVLAYQLDVNAILNKLADGALQLLQADEVSLMLPDSGGNELYIAAIRGAAKEHLLGRRVPIHQGVAGWVALHQEPMILNGPIEAQRFPGAEPRNDIVSSICYPMIVDGKLISLLNVNLLRSRRSFTLGEVKALSILANTAATALKSAFLIRDLRQAEHSARASEARFQAFMNHSPALACIKDQEGRYVYTNELCHSRFQGGFEPWLGKTDFEIWPAALAEVMCQHDREVLHSGSPQEALESYSWPAGTDSQWRVFRFPFQDPSGRELLGKIAIDITKQKEAEEERDRFFTISPDMICIAGFDGYFKRVNPTWTKTLGWSKEELLEQPYLEFVHPEDRSVTVSETDKLIHHDLKSFRFENRYRCKNGTYRWFQWHATPFSAHKVIYATARDVTDHKRLEDQLRQAQKMEAIGRLAGGIAHDFNNLLTIINGYSSLVYTNMPVHHSSLEPLREVIRAGERAASLTRQLLAFSRKQVTVPVILDLNTLAVDTQKLLRRLIGEDVELTTDLSPSLGKIKADPGQIEQVIMNLIVNARDAIANEGKIIIKTKNVQLDENAAQMLTDVSAGDYVEMAVSDTGCGMSQDTLSHIFEPFFTTKGPGKGTGLGLATVYGIVKQNRGYITVHSEVGKGTTFQVCFPTVESSASPAIASEPQRSKAEPARPKNTETILLVDDDDGIRSFAQTVLRNYGYNVLTARDGSDAFRLCQEFQHPIHLVIADVIMPGAGGPQLGKQLKALRPDVRLLFMSGYTDDAIVRYGVLEAHIPFIQKPFTPDLLANKVREVLDQSH